MPATDAVILDNMIPGPGGVSLRPGHRSHMTGGSASVESLLVYSSSSGSDKLFAAIGTAIYDATTGGTLPSAAVTSLNNSRFQSTMFQTSGGLFLVICNGADSVRNYDGSSWTTPSITGATSANLITVTAHAQRLWFAEKNTLNMWYLPVSSIAGAAVKFPLGAIAKKGGAVLAMASWTRDGGAGPDDCAVFITNKGEAIVYTGTDPSSSDTWSLVGVFNIPEPIGHRCWIKAGADVGIITSQGVIPLSTILAIDASGQGESAVTTKISGAFNSAYRAFSGLFGWDIIEYPKRELMIVNIPQAGGTTSHQYVMNRQTGGWCRFTGINAMCFALLGDELYLGKVDGTVHKLQTDYNDNDTPISCIVMPAFSDFGTPSEKIFRMAKPHFTAVAGTQVPVEVRVNYDTSPATIFPSLIPNAGSPWNTSPWDTSSWGPTTQTVAEWQSLQGIGRTGSIVIGESSLNALTLYHTDVTFEIGGPI